MCKEMDLLLLDNIVLSIIYLYINKTKVLVFIISIKYYPDI